MSELSTGSTEAVGSQSRGRAAVDETVMKKNGIAEEAFGVQESSRLRVTGRRFQQGEMTTERQEHNHGARL